MRFLGRIIRRLNNNLGLRGNQTLVLGNASRSRVHAWDLEFKTADLLTFLHGCFQIVLIWGFVFGNLE